ncbi:MAG: DsbA family protein, partial [Solirubrobacterales bacterium]|nr:DsbA family protein [Solirubrobacterales bacterium]
MSWRMSSHWRVYPQRGTLFISGGGERSSSAVIRDGNADDLGTMAPVIALESYRVRRAAVRGPRMTRTVFFFDLNSPWTYLAAERVDRFFPGVRWQPALPPGSGWVTSRDSDRECVAAHARAEALRLPLVWPDAPSHGRQAMRVAALAGEQGRGGAFVLAASRLAYCGGFDLEDPETVAEAAAAAGLGSEEAFEAAH